MGDMGIVGEGLMGVAALGYRMLLDSFGVQYPWGGEGVRHAGSWSGRAFANCLFFVDDALGKGCLCGNVESESILEARFAMCEIGRDLMWSAEDIEGADPIGDM